MARIQALELGPAGIRVNTVRPTVVLTKLALEAWDPAALEVKGGREESRTPLFRLI
jgi:NAD(P)-dependent dehydrogenase (short-subunit alcohol dehydrogenase family)